MASIFPPSSYGNNAMRNLTIESFKYTVRIRDKTFILSKAQIERDQPNYFTSFFLNDTGERINETLELSRDPHIFELVLKHLNHYQVLPIRDDLIPPGSSTSTVLADLRSDATFFQLNRLLEACSQKKTDLQYGMITGYFKATADGLAPTEDFDKFLPRFCLAFIPQESFEMQLEECFTFPTSASQGVNSLIVFGWSTRVVDYVLRRHAPSMTRWEIVGWKREKLGEIRHSVIFVKVWS